MACSQGGLEPEDDTLLALKSPFSADCSSANTALLCKLKPYTTSRHQKAAVATVQQPTANIATAVFNMPM